MNNRNGVSYQGVPEEVFTESTPSKELPDNISTSIIRNDYIIKLLTCQPLLLKTREENYEGDNTNSGGGCRGSK